MFHNSDNPLGVNHTEDYETIVFLGVVAGLIEVIVGLLNKPGLIGFLLTISPIAIVWYGVYRIYLLPKEDDKRLLLRVFLFLCFVAGVAFNPLLEAFASFTL